MPKYSITTDNGDGAQRSEESLEFPHTKAATDDAQIALADMAREKLPNGKHADFAVNVQDEAGNEIYRAGLSFTAKDENDIKRDNEEFDAAAEKLAASIRGHPRSI